MPQPNQFGASGQPLPFNNYAVTRAATGDVQSFDIRVDHQFSPVSTVFVRHSFQNTEAVVPSIFGLPLGGSPSGAGNTIGARNQNAGIGHTYQLSPTLINEMRIGLNRQTTALTQEDYGQNLSQQFGIPGVNLSPQRSGLSLISVSGLFNVGDSILTPLRIATTDWNFSEKQMWIKGRHTLRYGFDYQHEMGSTGYLVFGRGDYTFLNLSTSTLVGPPGGNAYASFLTGAPFQILRDTLFTPGMVGLISPRRYGFYAQDDFKISSTLTLNLGVRYDIMPYPNEMYNRLSNFDPATGTMLIAGQDTNPRLRDTDYKDLAPRIEGLQTQPRFEDGDPRGLRDRVHRSARGIECSEQQRIQHPVLFPQQYHGVSIHAADLRTQQPASSFGDSLPIRSHRRPKISGPHGSRPVFSNLDPEHSTGDYQILDGRNGVRGHQRSRSADHI